MEKAAIAAAALVTLGLAALVGAGAIRDIVPAQGAPAQAAVGGVSCPTHAPMVESSRYRRELDSYLLDLADDLREATLSDQPELLTEAQEVVCGYIMQNPQRGLAWLQLLSVSPSAARDPVARSALFSLSYDLSRLETDAVRARVVFAFDHWGELSDREQATTLRDVRTLALVPVGNVYVTQLAILAAGAGRTALASVRAIVTQVTPEYLPTFDTYAQWSAGKAR